MLLEKYAHLKLQKLTDEFKYVLFDNSDHCNNAISVLSKRNADFFSFSFKGEKSLICSSNEIGFDSSKTQDGWVGFKIIGEMPFGTVQGLISTISSSLFKDNIGVCIVSTFMTDIFLIKKDKAVRAMELLVNDGWRIQDEA